jgi:hypothetical protein
MYHAHAYRLQVFLLCCYHFTTWYQVPAFICFSILQDSNIEKNDAYPIQILDHTQYIYRKTTYPKTTTQNKNEHTQITIHPNILQKPETR